MHWKSYIYTYIYIYIYINIYIYVHFGVWYYIYIYIHTHTYLHTHTHLPHTHAYTHTPHTHTYTHIRPSIYLSGVALRRGCRRVSLYLWVSQHTLPKSVFVLRGTQTFLWWNGTEGERRFALFLKWNNIGIEMEEKHQRALHNHYTHWSYIYALNLSLSCNI